MEPKLNTNQPQVNLSKKEKIKLEREMRHQIITFVVMIFFTALAFMSVASDLIPASFAVPFILILAVIQVILQLYYFMHLKDKDHEWPNAFMLSGIVIIIPMVAALMLLLGVVKY
ncbi:cytochrome-c oxidase [Anaerobacillus arseniciselenatis]|uniref:Cytochrome-c oxidase n=1 Tax=Anaerobacillus arseniciselenatis TaxID=85682 RepID=A0A1S2LBZ1_9BACI|nr:cytochrome C oxidase subunit IV family protein [Anaerobacillus arseniciselenatis]OIJ09770.1 cytochrome-c oxidase [Anaerobacillus arseniciselenatis]